ncbi:MAG: BLUF domain-containing protein [Psychromonas sp.]
MSELMHLIYASKATIDFSDDDIVDLLTKARKNNHSLNVTGMLLFDKGSFLQVLEGEEETVNKLFTKISRDKRHANIVSIISEAISERYLNDWSMGYVSISRSELEKIEGMNDFFKDGSCLADIDKGRAKKVLNAFAGGRWRLE